MRFNVNLGLKKQTVPYKVENGRTIVSKMGLNAYFLAPNPLPHPVLATILLIITALETAYENALSGGKVFTQALVTAELNYDNTFIELGHYVEDRANSDPLNGKSIILAAGMIPKIKGGKTIPTFALKNNKISGNVDAKVKATKGAVYLFQTSPDPVAPATAYVWTQASADKKCKATLGGLPIGKKVWVRYALVIKGVQQDWSDPMSIVVM